MIERQEFAVVPALAGETAVVAEEVLEVVAEGVVEAVVMIAMIATVVVVAIIVAVAVAVVVVVAVGGAAGGGRTGRSSGQTCARSPRMGFVQRVDTVGSHSSWDWCSCRIGGAVHRRLQTNVAACACTCSNRTNG